MAWTPGESKLELLLPEESEVICKCSKGTTYRHYTRKYHSSCKNYYLKNNEPFCKYSKTRCEDTEVVEVYRKKEK